MSDNAEGPFSDLVPALDPSLGARPAQSATAEALPSPDRTVRQDKPKRLRATPSRRASRAAPTQQRYPLRWSPEEPRGQESRFTQGSVEACCRCPLPNSESAGVKSTSGAVCRALRPLFASACIARAGCGLGRFDMDTAEYDTNTLLIVRTISPRPVLGAKGLIRFAEQHLIHCLSSL